MPANPLSELRSLLSASTPTGGVVTAITAGTGTVATRSGLVTAALGPGVGIGSRVTIADGVARLAAPASAVYAV